MQPYPKGLAYSCKRVLVELEDEPVELGRDADEHFANNVDHLSMVRINGTSSPRASGEEYATVLLRNEQPYRDPLFRCRYRRRVRKVSADRQLALCRGP